MLERPLLPPEEHHKAQLMENNKSILKQPEIYKERTAIPFPLLQSMLQLADKYALPQTTIETLGEHLSVYVQANALQVYALATSYGLGRVASKASEYLIPIGLYGFDEIKMLPTVEAYHKIVQLQDYRVKAMKELVLTEDIFPHGMSIITESCLRDELCVVWK